ncbi:uncharacterized protein [Drosophila bipectinata]|uniref:uncharacterized protein n=1 Tax=Drosophila bipectinata TaxID=42026 RepID=UPI0038B264D5
MTPAANALDFVNLNRLKLNQKLNAHSKRGFTRGHLLVSGPKENVSAGVSGTGGRAGLLTSSHTQGARDISRSVESFRAAPGGHSLKDAQVLSWTPRIMSGWLNATTFGSRTQIHAAICCCLIIK